MRKSVFYSLLLIGTTAISSQIILIREFFTVFYGNELSVGFILAIWLVGGSLGSGLLGNLFADRIQRGLFLFALIQVILSILIPCGIIFARISRHLFGIGVGEIVSLPVFLASSSLVLLPITIALGFLFVLGCKIIPEAKPSSVGIGRVYTLEAIGALLGGVITSLILVRYLGTFQIAFIVSLLNLASAFFLLQKDHAQEKSYLRIVSFSLIFILIIFATLGGVDFIDRKSLNLKWAGFTVLESNDSIYGRTTVTSKDGQFSFFNNGLFLFSSHDLLTAEEVVHFPLAFAPEPKRVLLIGGGASEIMNEILKHPVRTVDYVELDPSIISLSKKFLKEEPFYRLDDPKANIINQDGRYFIKNTKNTYNAVIINLPNPYTAQINRFYTKEFFKEIKRILSRNAIVSFGVSSSENYLSKEQSLFLKTLFETAKSEFEDVKVIPGDTAYFLLSNKKDAISLNYEAILNQLKSRGIETRYVREYYLFSKLSKDRIEFLRSAMGAVGAVSKNVDFYPISYFYDMVLWSTYFSFKISKFLLFLTKGRLLWFTFVFLSVLFLLLLIRRRLYKDFKKEAVLVALGTTGLSEIAFEILIVIAFQIIYGYLYYKIGIIVTSFMFGLSLGSIYITRRLTKIKQPYRMYILVQIAVLVYPLLLLLFFKAFTFLSNYPKFNRIGSDLFCLLPFIAGLVGGIQYPLANMICLTQTQHIGKTASTTYAVDLFGSFIGAFLISSFFVPIVGLPTTCVLVSLLNTMSLVFLLIGSNS